MGCAPTEPGANWTKGDPAGIVRRNRSPEETVTMNTAAAVKPAPRADVPNDLSAFWLPFTPNRAFKKKPRLIARAKDMHYFTPEGREILDGTAGLWCCHAGPN